MSYAYSENYILVLSHDEVVHLKCSMLNKMPGIGADKYSNLKAGYAFMMGHAGQRLLFMGQEFPLGNGARKGNFDWYLLAEGRGASRDAELGQGSASTSIRRNKAMYEQDQSSGKDLNGSMRMTL